MGEEDTTEKNQPDETDDLHSVFQPIGLPTGSQLVFSTCPPELVKEGTTCNNKGSSKIDRDRNHTVIGWLQDRWTREIQTGLP